MHRNSRPLAVASLMLLLASIVPPFSGLRTFAAPPTSPEPAAAETGPPFDAERFGRMTRQQRVAAVVQAVRWRERRMQNFSYGLTADVENVPFDKDRPCDAHRLLKRPTEHFGLLRKESQYLFYGRITTPSHDFWSHWDGRVFRTLSFDRGTGERRAVIRDTEQRGVYEVQANHVVGFRSVGIRWIDYERGVVRAEPATLPECLEHFLRLKFPTRAGPERRGDKTLVRLQSLTYGMKPQVWWFDPDRDWMPVRFESRDLDAPPVDKDAADYGDADAGNVNVLDVTEAAQSGGLWVPMKVVCRYRLSTTDRGNIQTVRTYVFRHFTVGTATGEELRVPFPQGTSVVDEFAEVAYVLRARFVAEPRPLFVTRLGKGVIAGEAELSDALAANPSNDDVPPGDPARADALKRVAARRNARSFESDPLRGFAAPAFPAGAEWVNCGPM